MEDTTRIRRKVTARTHRPTPAHARKRSPHKRTIAGAYERPQMHALSRVLQHMDMLMHMRKHARALARARTYPPSHAHAHAGAQARTHAPRHVHTCALNHARARSKSAHARTHARTRSRRRAGPARPSAPSRPPPPCAAYAQSSGVDTPPSAAGAAPSRAPLEVSPTPSPASQEGRGGVRECSLRAEQGDVYKFGGGAPAVFSPCGERGRAAPSRSTWRRFGQLGGGSTWRRFNLKAVQHGGGSVNLEAVQLEGGSTWRRFNLETVRST